MKGLQGLLIVVLIVVPGRAYADFLAPEFDYFIDGFAISELRNSAGDIVARVGVGAHYFNGEPLPNDGQGNFFIAPLDNGGTSTLFSYTAFWELLPFPPDHDSYGEAYWFQHLWDSNPEHLTRYYDLAEVSGVAVAWDEHFFLSMTFAPGFEAGWSNWYETDENSPYYGYAFNPTLTGVYTFSAAVYGLGQSVYGTMNVHVMPIEDDHVIPEPSTLILLGMGAGAILCRYRTKG